MRIPTNSSSNNPNWLDKLRRFKGFPFDNNNEVQTLDHFLSQQHQHQQQAPNYVDDSHLVKRRASTPENDDVSTRMSNMLSDLFCSGRIGDGQTSNFKAPRKQSNPRMCILPAVAAAAVVTEDKGSNESERLSVDDEDVSLGLKPKVGRMGLKEKELRGKRLGESELVGFSRTEVTVIDSSNPLWKFDKYLFRKKNVWKARDCRIGSVRQCDKSNGVGFGRKRKREGVDDDGVVSKKSKSFRVRK